MELLVFKGLVLGFIYSVALVSGTVWCVQVTLRSGLLAGGAVVSAIALSQALLGGAAVLALYGLFMVPVPIGTALRLMAVVVFLYMAVKMLFAPKAKTLAERRAGGRPGRLFSATFALSITMPMRLGGYLAFSIAAGLPQHGLTGSTVLLLAATVGIGAFIWFGYIVLLARLFGHRVPETVSLRSINKLNTLTAIVFFLVAIITAIPLLIEL